MRTLLSEAAEAAEARAETVAGRLAEAAAAASSAERIMLFLGRHL